VVRIHRLHGELMGETRDGVARDVMADNEGAAVGGERAVELRNGLVDEIDAAIGSPGQRIQDLAIEDERAMHNFGIVQRMVERRVVEIAQIATEPDEGLRVPERRRHAVWTGQCVAAKVVCECGRAGKPLIVAHLPCDYNSTQ
jgi:hypothetical protein